MPRHLTVEDDVAALVDAAPQTTQTLVSPNGTHWAVQIGDDGTLAGSLSATAYGPPAELLATLNGDGSVTLRWPRVQQAFGYELHVSSQIGGMSFLTDDFGNGSDGGESTTTTITVSHDDLVQAVGSGTNVFFGLGVSGRVTSPYNTDGDATTFTWTSTAIRVP